MALRVVRVADPFSRSIKVVYLQQILTEVSEDLVQALVRKVGVAQPQDPNRCKHL